MSNKPEPTYSWVEYRKYVLITLASPVVLLAVLVLAISMIEGRIPAPRFSISESFNEKARWLRNNLSNGCDVLIIGSSMALHNIDGLGLTERLRGRSVVNAGSWGMSISESGRLLQSLAPLCKPKIIILPIFHGDFDNPWEKVIDWELFEKYIHRKHVAFSYIESLDPIYYYQTYISRQTLLKKGNSIYQSLFFDRTGSVMFDCVSFEIDPARWNAHNKFKELNQGVVESNLSGLHTIEAISKATDAQLLVIVTPLRAEAEDKMQRPEILELWGRTADSVVLAGGTFIKMSMLTDFDDRVFTDVAHLNKCGAGKVIEYISPIVEKLLREALQKSS